ncbi:MAG: tyrosinase family protein [Rhizobiales bacterium]|nr:tyrosinase family protein [Hyphomicrobiales bacterium]
MQNKSLPSRNRSLVFSLDGCILNDCTSVRLGEGTLMHNFDRRTLLQGGAAVALVTTVPTTEALAATVTRRSIASLALNSPTLNSYRKAVAAMKALPSSDPRNWTKQAQIHLNHCPHGNWYFLPWHRAYLHAFEKLCQQLSGDPNFALPYWDWTANPQLPAAFATPTYNGQPNPLFNNTRNSQTVSIPASVAGPSVMSGIYAETNFQAFGSAMPTGQNSTAPTWQRAPGSYGSLEGGPHNSVHGIVGGEMATYMSPLDAIFWLHHCNIDRIWDRWNNLGRANTTNNLWRTFAFNGNFVLPSGANGTTPYNPTVASVLSILALEYRYDSPLVARLSAAPVLAKFVDLNKPLHLIQADVIGPAKINTALVTKVALRAPQVQALIAAVRPMTELTAAATKETRATGRVIATIRDIEPPMQGNASVRVFVNCAYLTAETPIEDRHYAGSFSFFGIGHDEQHGKLSYIIDITNTVAKLQHAGEDVSNEINVQLMPVALPGVTPASDFKPGKVEVAIF